MRATGAAVVHAAVSAEPLDADALWARAAVPRAGGVVVFHGVVRDHDHGRAVTSLEYAGHPTAGGVLAEVVAETAAEPEVLAVVAEHRVGTLAVGDTALVAVVACAHRGAAFEACGRLVDEIKRRLPVWKRQVFADGTDEWVDCP